MDLLEALPCSLKGRIRLTISISFKGVVLMPQEYIALFLLFGFLILIAFRIPVAVSLAMASLVGLLIGGNNVINFSTRMFTGLDMYTLLAVPFFLITGFLISSTTISDRVLDLSVILIGKVRGGLGHINVLVSMLFAGISGSAQADTAGVGSVLIPMMKRRGYSAAYSVAITAITSTIGSIIPPSILMIVYAAYANVSVAALFIGGIVPGIAIGVGSMLINFYYTHRYKIDGGGTMSLNIEESSKRYLTILKVIWRALPVAFIPIIILWGVTSGTFTATEAGFIALLYVVVLVVIIYKELNLKQFMKVLVDSLLFYSLPLLAAAGAILFGWVLTYFGMGEAIRSIVEGLSLPDWGFLLVVVLIFLIAGTFLDGFPAIVLFTPILIETSNNLGIDPIHLGIVTALTLAIGLTTPPYGLCLLIASKLAKLPVSKAIKPMLPFWVICLLIILLSVLFPKIVLFLPEMFVPESFN